MMRQASGGGAMPDDPGDDLLAQIEAAETNARLERLGKLIPRRLRVPDRAQASRLMCGAGRPRRKARDEKLADVVQNLTRR